MAVVVLLLTVVAVQARNPASYVSEGVARITEGPGPAAPVDQMTGIDQLKATFDADQGHPRLILLLSPT